MLYMVLMFASKAVRRLRWKQANVFLHSPTAQSLPIGTIVSVDKAFHVAWIAVAWTLAWVKCMLAMWICDHDDPMLAALLLILLTFSELALETTSVLLVHHAMERDYFALLTGVRLSLVEAQTSTCRMARYKFVVVGYDKKED